MREQGVGAIVVLNHDDYRWFFGFDRAQPRAIIPADGAPALVAFEAEAPELRELIGDGEVLVWGSVGGQINDVVTTPPGSSGPRRGARSRGHDPGRPPAVVRHARVPGRPVQAGQPGRRGGLVGPDHRPAARDQGAGRDRQHDGRPADRRPRHGPGTRADPRRRDRPRDRDRGPLRDDPRRRRARRAPPSGSTSAARPACSTAGRARNPMRTGDLVVVDLTPVVDGYCANLARTFVLGEPDERQRSLLDAYAAGSRPRATRCGRARRSRGRRAPAGVLRDRGLGDHHVNGIGHGIGLRFEETPASTIIPPHRNVPLARGDDDHDRPHRPRDPGSRRGAPRGHPPRDARRRRRPRALPDRSGRRGLTPRAGDRRRRGWLVSTLSTASPAAAWGCREP